eukprot:1156987-Pelagomonas_calceolata.AAC.1
MVHMSSYQVQRGAGAFCTSWTALLYHAKPDNSGPVVMVIPYVCPFIYFSFPPKPGTTIT